VPVESSVLLPVLFVTVAALFATLAQRMAREMRADFDPLRAYTLNLAGSLAGVVAFGVVSWLNCRGHVVSRAFLAAAPLLAPRQAARSAAVPPCSCSRLASCT